VDIEVDHVRHVLLHWLMAFMYILEALIRGDYAALPNLSRRRGGREPA
jgi:hypothetical protein